MATNGNPTIKAPPLRAFDCYDSSVFLSWMKAVSDLMMSGSVENCARETGASLGGLLYSLSEAAEELAEREQAAQH